MKYLLLSRFLDGEITPFIYGAFLSRIMTNTIGGKQYFYAYSDFRKSKAVNHADFGMFAYADELVDVFNAYSGYDNWEITTRTDKSTALKFYLLNDMHISEEELFEILYSRLLDTNWIKVSGMTNEKRSFIRGFLELRGSVDTSLNFIAQDYFFNNDSEFKKRDLFTKYMSVPARYTNYNPRENQPQYRSGEVMRNDQNRLNLKYYAREIGFIIKYKAAIFENSYHPYGRSERNDITYFNC